MSRTNLVLSRRVEESVILIDSVTKEHIRVLIADARNGSVKLLFTAAPRFQIFREELLSGPDKSRPE